MTLPKFTHIKPADLDEALEFLSEKGSGAKINSGGSDLMVQLKQRTITPEYVIDVKDLEGFQGISTSGQDVTTIGALTSLETIASSEQIQSQFPILAQAAGKVASVQIRNVGTLGGNICLSARCWYYNQSAQWRKAVSRCYKVGGNECLVIKNSDQCNAVFLADTVPALMALDARVKIVKKGGQRTLPISEFYTGSGHPENVLAPNEILAEIQVPKTADNTFSLFFKDAPREVVDFARANGAMCVTFKGNTGICETAKIAVGGVTSRPVQCAEGQNALAGKEITDELAKTVADLVVKESGPYSPIWVTPTTRREAIRAFVYRGLKAAAADNKKQ